MTAVLSGTPASASTVGKMSIVEASPSETWARPYDNIPAPPLYMMYGEPLMQYTGWRQNECHGQLQRDRAWGPARTVAFRGSGTEYVSESGGAMNWVGGSAKQ